MFFFPLTRFMNKTGNTLLAGELPFRRPQVLPFFSSAGYVNLNKKTKRLPIQ